MQPVVLHQHAGEPPFFLTVAGETCGIDRRHFLPAREHGVEHFASVLLTQAILGDFAVAPAHQRDDPPSRKAATCSMTLAPRRGL